MEQVRECLDQFQPRGKILELACDTGFYAQQLLGYAQQITAIDAALETLEWNGAWNQADGCPLSTPGTHQLWWRISYGFFGNRRKREEIGGMGRASPAPYPHIFPSITATPREPTNDSIIQIAAMLEYWHQMQPLA